jgi:signal transduction histidine kinase
MSATGQPSYPFRDLSFARSGKATSYAVLGLAAGLCIATGALVWFGYVATREWRRGTELLMERRQAEAIALVSAALDRDMKGASTSLLIPMNHAMIEEDPPYDLVQSTARVFARFPYPESLVIWKRTPGGDGVTYVFNRAERRPLWDESPEADEPFPVVIRQNPSGLANLISTLRSQHQSGRSFAVAHVTLADVPYQVVVHFLLDPAPPFELSGFAAFTVNLSWARNEYFMPVLQQAATIGGNADVMSFSVNDERGEAVAITGPALTGPRELRRTFPLLFIDQVLLTLPRHEAGGIKSWTVHVRLSSDSALASASEGTRRTFALIAISALVSIGALLVTVRAVEAKAALATMKSDFVSAVTHELKTPVALIRLVGDTLASGRYSSPSAVEEYARLMSQEAMRLGQSIDQLLTYARYSEAQKRHAPQFSALDIGELLEHGVETVRPALTAAGFDIEMQVSPHLPPVAVDRAAITQAIENIIDNAIKYAGTTPALRISVHLSGKFVTVTFQDRGIGIPPEDVENVFERFYRGRNVSNAGSGLGLTIVKRILEYHGGQIRIRSTINVGTVVELLLPIAA